MFFLPFRVDLGLHRFPILTLLVSVACLVIFTQQLASFNAVKDSILSYCGTLSDDSRFALVIRNVSRENGPQGCPGVIYALFSSEAPEQDIEELAENAARIEAFSADYSRHYIQEQLGEKFSQFQRQHKVEDLTDKLMYKPDSFNVTNMITAAFAHGSWMHVIGNLFFFFAFAASVEIAVGLFAYSLIFIALAIGTHLSYSLSLLNVPDALPTLGLSGVVMGMIGLFAYLMPMVKIRCIWWFLIFFRTVAVPAWILAAWYVGWDIYNLNHSDDQSNVNFVAHVSGAAIGFLIGVIFFRRRKAEIKQEIVQQRESGHLMRAMSKQG